MISQVAIMLQRCSLVRTAALSSPASAEPRKRRAHLIAWTNETEHLLVKWGDG